MQGAAHSALDGNGVGRDAPRLGRTISVTALIDKASSARGAHAAPGWAYSGWRSCPIPTSSSSLWHRA
jgi:hypothetical protein